MEFPPMEANKIPQSMTVSATDGFEKEFKNILIGDVWFASGQSNMEMHLGGAKEGEFVTIMGPSGAGKSTLLNIIGMLANQSTDDVNRIDVERIG